NHEETVNFFDKHNNFGLAETQINFFSQEELPLLNAEGNFFLAERGSIAQGPDGNGSCLFWFLQSGLYQAWALKGIEHLNLILIDNALADPFDAELIGFHARTSADITVKCIERMTPDEK